MKAKIYYHDIGDYLSRDEKLAIVKKNRSIANMQWQVLTPNEHGDWLNQRNDAFSSFIPLEPEKKFDAKAKSFFNTNVIAVSSNRDAWVYNFSKGKVAENMQRMIDFYNEQSTAFSEAIKENSKLEIEDFIDTNPAKISWTVNLKKDVERGSLHKYFESEQRMGMYRPFTKQRLYFDKPFIERPGLNSMLFPNEKFKNIVINITGIGASKPFSVLISDKISSIDCIEKNQCFPLYYYEENKTQQRNIFDGIAGQARNDGFVRRDAISDFILERVLKGYGVHGIGYGEYKNDVEEKNKPPYPKPHTLSKEDIFYYVYGFLHSPQYRETFASDLKKMLPRLPLVEDVRDFWAFSKAGRALAELHLNYENIWNGVWGMGYGAVVLYNPLNIADTLKQANVEEIEYLNYRVEKMRFPKKDQKDTIIYNSQITIENIPAEAYEYIVNGKSAVEWVMERYQITTHKESGIKNDPNDWAKENGKPRYILDLLLSVINVSVKTVEIVKNLPEVKFE